jgi:hypothetical protein
MTTIAPARNTHPTDSGRHYHHHASTNGSGGKASHGERPQPIDPAEVRRALTLLVDSAHAVELRVVKPKARSVVRPGSDLDGLVKAARKLSGAPAVYVGLNPNRLTPGNRLSAKVTDVVRRRWLLVDVDPVRPPDTNSTDAEHDAARDLAGVILDILYREHHWPLPVQQDSGNGWHLLYRIDLPNDDEAHDLVKAVLEVLAARFDTEHAKVDTVVHDAPRICKLAGTWARKGPHSDERPHRPCRLAFVPETVEVVSADLLRGLVGQQVEDEIPAPALDELRELETEELDDPARPAQGDSRADVEQRAIAYLAKMPPAVQGQGGSGVTMYAARVVVHGFDLGPDVGFRLLDSHYNHRCEPPWTEKELRHKCEDADTKPFNKARGWLLQQDRPSSRSTALAKVKSPPQPSKPTEVFPLGDVELIVAGVRKTLTKVIITVLVFRDGQRIDKYELTGAHTNRRQTASALGKLVGKDATQDAIDATISRLLTFGDDLAKAPSPLPTGVPILSILKDEVPQYLGLRCRTHTGLWSEALGREIDRNYLCHYTPEWLLVRLRDASDAPPDDTGLIWATRTQLGVLWSNLTDPKGSPSEREAVELGPDSRRAAMFCQAILTLFNRLEAGEKVKLPDGGERITRASLAELARRMPWKHATEGVAWVKITQALSAWWRRQPMREGGEVIGDELAFTFALASEVKVTLPGVTCADDLAILGERYGALKRQHPTSALLVLTPQLTRTLLDQPDDSAGEGDGCGENNAQGRAA